jgi:hypothetical protein
MSWNFSVEKTARPAALRRPMLGTFAAVDPRVEEAAQLVHVAGRKCGSGTSIKNCGLKCTGTRSRCYVIHVAICEILWWM